MSIRKLIITVLALFTCSYSQIGYSIDGRFCQKGTYVAFGNGVWNDVESAYRSTLLLQHRLEAKVSGTPLEGAITYFTQHNPSEGTLADLRETFTQNDQTDDLGFWKILFGISHDLNNSDCQAPAFNCIKNAYIEAANKVRQRIIQTNPAVQDHIERYNQLLSEGNKVVVVSHSQGNLFANIAYLGIKQEYINGFGIVSVGNPDSYVAGNGPYTTLWEDLIINPLPGSLPPNVDNFSLFDGPYGINSRDPTGHQFGTSYMLEYHDAEPKILNDVVNVINSRQDPYTNLQNGIITASLTWGNNPDVDLHVIEPDGTHVYYRNPLGNSGYLDRDDINSYGPEHYYVSCANIKTGTYQFGVNYYYGYSPETCNLTLKVADQIRSESKYLPQWYFSAGDENPQMMFLLHVTGSNETGFEYVIQSY